MDDRDGASLVEDAGVVSVWDDSDRDIFEPSLAILGRGIRADVLDRQDPPQPASARRLPRSAEMVAGWHSLDA